MRACAPAARAELGLRDEDLVALFVGSEWRGKGLDIAIDALETCREWRLVVVGDGDAGRARRRAKRSAQRISWCWSASPRSRNGTTPQPMRSSCRARMSHSRSWPSRPLPPGFPSWRRPVGAITELVEAGGGINIEPDAADLAAALARLAADPSARSTMGDRGRQLAAEHGWDRIVDSYLALYSPVERSEATLVEVGS